MRRAAAFAFAIGTPTVVRALVRADGMKPNEARVSKVSSSVSALLFGQFATLRCRWEAVAEGRAKGAMRRAAVAVEIHRSGTRSGSIAFFMMV